MTIPKKLLARLSITVALVTLTPAASLAGDESFSSVVKHIKSSYHAKQQGFFGAMMLARFAVKMIKPAGVKNFKLVLLRDLDYSEVPSQKPGQFYSFIERNIDPRWTPLVQYSSQREKQWSYVYITSEKEDVKLLVVTIQQNNAVVMQTKFSPAKLIEFMNNPQIMGISLNSDNRSTHHEARGDGADQDDNDPSRQKSTAVKPPDER